MRPALYQAPPSHLLMLWLKADLRGVLALTQGLSLRATARSDAA